MKRKDYIINTIYSAVFLAAGCKEGAQQDIIISRANEMLNSVWEVEYKSYFGLPDHKVLQVRDFWDSISFEMVNEKKVYSLYAWFSPPGKEENVTLHVQPVNTAMTIVFSLKVNKKSEKLDIFQKPGIFIDRY